METQVTTPVQGEASVIGISRSGRVRKKSSKLLDFQSPDDIEALKAKKAAALHNRQHKNYAFLSPGHIKQEPELDLDDNYELSASDMEIGQNYPDEQSESMDDDYDDDTDDLGPDAYMGGPPTETDDLVAPYEAPSARQSIYMTEKSNKKKMMMKDGKVVMEKAHRKDKGKSRFTAYMLWAKTVRQQILSKNPDLDFSSVSKRLGEMWANVPSGEKYNWRRRAKRLVSKGKSLSFAADKMVKRQDKGSSKFINQKAGSSTNKLTKKMAAAAHGSSSSPEKTTRPYHKKQPTTGATKIKTEKVKGEKIKEEKKTHTERGSGATYKVTGQQPADIAAYLKLLGDNLTIIGERLKEHEGQITVSGSLSVLLDSMLCSIGPLMCLTTYVPGLGEQLGPEKQQLLQILDNIAYVMPGL